MTELAEAIYAVVEHDGTLLGYYSTQQFADDAIREFAYDGMRVVKYVPQPTLTDAERVAAQTLMYLGESSPDVGDKHAADTIRALLERLGDLK